MKLFLMQHGKQLSMDQDPEEGLSDEGILSVEKSSKVLKKLNLFFDLIFCSPKKRSKQTAEIVAKNLKMSKDNINETDKVKATKDVSEILEVLEFLQDEKKVLIAGHLPSISKIISFFISKSDVNIDIQNASIIAIEIEKFQRECGKLLFYLPTNILDNFLLK